MSMAATRMGCGTSCPGPLETSSAIETSEPLPSGWTVISTRAVPTGQPRASKTIRSSGWISRTSVVSSITSGQIPKEWWSFLPSAGQPSSTSRMRDAPTTHKGYSQPSPSTSQTCLAEQLNQRCVAISAFLLW